MAVSVLLMTPNEGFGELICQTLESKGGYDIVQVGNGQESLAQAQKRQFTLAILDSDVQDLPIAELGHTLKSWYADLRIIIVPPDNNREDSRLGGLSPDGFLTKPFYLPELLGVIESVLHGERAAFRKGGPSGVAPPDREPSLPPTMVESLSKPTEPPPDPQPPPWLQDVNRAAQHLTRLSLESAAQAALITRGDKLWAYAGGYPQPVAQELADAVNHYWGRQGGSDLARFIRLDTTGEEYMLYATSLAGDMVLSLVFDAQTPFSKIRSQASQLAQALASRPEEGTRLVDVDNVLRQEGQTNITTTMLDAPITKESQNVAFDNTPYDWLPASPVVDDILEETDPETAPTIPADWQPSEAPTGERRSFLEDLIEDALPTVPFPYEGEELLPFGVGRDRPGRVGVPVKEATEDEKAQIDQDAGQEPLEKEAVPFHLAKTKPSTIQHRQRVQRPVMVDSPSTIEPVLPSEPTPALYNLIYACVLVPRFPHHHLTSDLAARLGEWVPQICVAFGWRVEHLSIRPDYAQWMVNVPPATSPGYLMRIIRRVTSQRVFASFPRLEDENPSGEFWAPGYLIISSTKLPPPRMVKDFITQTRKRQGIGK